VRYRSTSAAAFPLLRIPQVLFRLPAAVAHHVYRARLRTCCCLLPTTTACCLPCTPARHLHYRSGMRSRLRLHTPTLPQSFQLSVGYARRARRCHPTLPLRVERARAPHAIAVPPGSPSHLPHCLPLPLPDLLLRTACVRTRTCHAYITFCACGAAPPLCWVHFCARYWITHLLSTTHLLRYIYSVGWILVTVCLPPRTPHERFTRSHGFQLLHTPATRTFVTTCLCHAHTPATLPTYTPLMMMICGQVVGMWSTMCVLNMYYYNSQQ